MFTHACSVDHRDAEALLICCTDFNTFDSIEPLEAKLKKPVISSNSATLWHSLRDAGISDPIQGLVGYYSITEAHSRPLFQPGPVPLALRNASTPAGYAHSRMCKNLRYPQPCNHCAMRHAYELLIPASSSAVRIPRLSMLRSCDPVYLRSKRHPNNIGDHRLYFSGQMIIFTLLMLGLTYSSPSTSFTARPASYKSLFEGSIAIISLLKVDGLNI